MSVDASARPYAKKKKKKSDQFQLGYNKIRVILPIVLEYNIWHEAG